MLLICVSYLEKVCRTPVSSFQFYKLSCLDFVLGSVVHLLVTINCWIILTRPHAIHSTNGPSQFISMKTILHMAYLFGRGGNLWNWSVRYWSLLMSCTLFLDRKWSRLDEEKSHLIGNRGRFSFGRYENTIFCMERLTRENPLFVPAFCQF